MNKIIQAINSMISNSTKISNVIIANNDEYFFVYNNKYKWSIREINEGINLFLYPENEIKLEELAFDVDYSTYKKFITYSSKDFKSTEAIESFQELLRIVKNKIYGVDNILDDILNEN